MESSGCRMVHGERLIGWKGETYLRGEGSVCKDLDDSCEYWASDGECSANTSVMRIRCPAACQFCNRMTKFVATPTSRPANAIPDSWSRVPTVKLSNGVIMPRIGFGTAGLGCERSHRAVLEALLVGYRHIDTAQANEWYCEEAVGRAILESGVPREELFLVSKQHPRDHGWERTTRMFHNTLSNLHTDHMDLFLLHYPRCWGTLCQGTPPAGTWKDAWRALEDMVQQKRVRAIGVSNFSPEELDELMEYAHIKPTVVQSHSDPLISNSRLQQRAEAHGLVYTAYSSLGTQHGYDRPNPVLTNPVINEIAQMEGRSPAQIVLRWALDHNQVVIPRSGSHAHMKDNLDLDFYLSKEQRERIDKLDSNRI